jgi:serine/threonine-protein kinase
MARSCPACNRQFGDDDEFCPYDGKRLLRGETDFVGQTLDGRYVIETKIGEGGMGVVYAGHHAVIERRVAIKVLKAAFAQDPGQANRFLQEAKAASRIGHPNVVDVFDFGQAPDGSAYFVMEYIEGQTLSTAMRNGPIGAARGATILAQLLRALQAAHDKGVIHRDLKPDNIFLTLRDGMDFVKIVDFGIAKVQAPASARLTRIGAVFGTPDYMSPEQAMGKEADARADIFALGVVLYEMLTGQKPFHGENAMATMSAVMMEPAKPPTQVRPDLDIPKVLEDVALKAMEKSPNDRYPTCADMLHALEEAAGGIPTLAPGALSASYLGEKSGGFRIARGLSLDESGSVQVARTPSQTSVPPTVADGPPASMPRRSRVPMAAGLLVGAAVVAFGIAFVLRGKSEHHPATTIGETLGPQPALPDARPPLNPSIAASVHADAGAQVHLVSVPAGAQVVEPTGTPPTNKPICVTPCDVMPPGPGAIRHLKLQLAGYADGSAEVAYGATGTMTVPLQTAPTIQATIAVVAPPKPPIPPGPTPPGPTPPLPPLQGQQGVLPPGNPQATDLQNPFGPGGMGTPDPNSPNQSPKKKGSP